MSSKIIFVDMDGVLSDFEKRYLDLFNESPIATRDRKHERGAYGRNWQAFIDGENFATLDKFTGFETLVSFLNSLSKVNIKILTSSGGDDRHNDVARQKMEWTKKQGIDWPVVVVPGRRFKAAFANEKTFLIDDTVSNIEGFIASGGSAVLHTNVDDTIKETLLWLGESK